MKLWTGQTVSQFGSTVTREAIPLTALLALGATPVQMGFLAALSGAPVLLLGLVAGVWVDRLRRRPIMIWSDLGRAALLGTIPVAALLGHLSLAHLLVVASLAGVLTVFFDVAYQSLVPGLVGREQIVEANSKLEVSAAASEVTAPGLAGVLVQTISGPLAILLDACSFLFSAAMVWLIRTPEPPPTPDGARQHLVREAADGMAVVLRQPVLRALGVSTLIGSFFGNFYATLYALYALRELHLGPALLGLAVACGGAGGLAGALFAQPASRRFGIGPAIVGTALLNALVGLLTPLAAGPPLVAAAFLMAGQIFGDGLATVRQIAATSVRQALAPPALLGRVNASMHLLALGVAPLGALTGGVLGEWIGIRPTVWIAVVGSGLGLLWLLFSPLPSLHEIPPVAAANAAR
jgi:predicted MFS family arabinose efflux permease